MTGGFRAAWGAGPDVGVAARACAERLGRAEGCGLGVLYVSDAAAHDLAGISRLIAESSGVERWIGGVGVGVCAAALGEAPFESHDGPAVVALALPFDAAHVRLFHAMDEEGLGRMLEDMAGWAVQAHPGLAVIHADPRAEEAVAVIRALDERAQLVAVGCFTASPSLMGEDYEDDEDGSEELEIVEDDMLDWRDAPPDQIAGGPFAGAVSGALIGGALQIASGLTQGCAPMGPLRTVTQAEGNVIVTLDERPALEALIEDGGPDIGADLRRISGSVFLARHAPRGRERDYMVRNLLAVDARNGWIAIGDLVEEGESVRFARRDHEAAEADMRAMLEELKAGARRPPRGALYHSCAARGPNMFTAPRREIDLIREVFPETLVVGVFGNGEISQGRVYGYTGVLTLFF